MFKVRAQNFLTFKELEFDFSNRGLCLIQGENRDEPLEKSNGAGKTNLIAALAWGVYGQFEKIKSADKVVNNQAGKDCWVETTWGPYRVLRFRKHTQFKNDLQFYINGVEKTAKSNKDTQILIDEAVGLSYESFIHSIYFQQNVLTAFATATDAQQKEIIENILNLSVLSVAQEVCKEKVKEYRLDIAEVEIKLSQVELMKADCESRVQQLTIKSEQFEDQRKADCRLINERINQLHAQKNVAHPAFDIEQARQMIDLTIPLAEEIKRLEAQVLDINLRKRNVQNIEITARTDVRTLQQDVARLTDELDRVRRSDTGKCPTCKQDVPKKFGQDHVDALNLSIESAKLKVAAAEERLRNTPSTADLEAEVSGIQASVKSKRELLDVASQLKHKIVEEEFRLKQIAMIDAHIAEAEQRFTEAAGRENPYNTQIAEEAKKVAEAQVICVDLVAVVDNLKDEAAYHTYWVDGLANSKLKSYIMDSITPILNERANHYSQLLTGGVYEIEISTQSRLKSGEMRDKFSVNIKTMFGSDYEQCSGGQRKRIDICILLALQDLVASRASQPLQLLVMDEVSENLDDIGVERMLELLHKIAAAKDSCFYITHDESMKPLFPSSITVVKEHGVSSVGQ
jgi:DNA repair exonuclease SbcCD ATPase subunit